MKTLDLTKDSIPKLIRILAIPSIIGFFFNTMYNVVDTYYAGQLSTLGQAALSVSFPVFFLIIAIGAGISSGVTALIGHEVGEGNKEKAAHYGIQALTFSVIISVLVTILGFIISPFLFKFLGAQGEYLSLALQYMNTLYWGTILFIVAFTCNGILNAIGDTKSYRNVLIMGFFLNIILNPTFMWGWGPLPAMGMAGIAFATITAQLISVSYLLWKVSKLELMHIGIRKHIKPQWKYYKEIAKQGFPASLNMMTVAIGVFVITYFVSQFGESAVAAYGIGTRIEQIALLPMFGMNIAVLSIIAQNRGAKLIERVRETLKISIKYSAYMMIIGLVLLFGLAPWLMQIFTQDPAVLAIGVPFLRIEAFSLMAYVLLFLADSVFRAYKKPSVPLWFNLFRQILIPLPIYAIMIFVFKTNIYGLWFSIFTIVWISAIVFMGMTYKLVHKELD